MNALLLVLTGCSSVISYTPPEAAPPPLFDDTAADSGDDSAADSGDDTAADSGGDTAADTAPDTAADTWADTAVDTADTWVDTAVDTGADTASSSVPVSPYTGTFGTASVSELGVGVHPWHVHVGDFDGDGRDDLAYTWNVELFGGDELNVAVHFQDASGALGPALSMATGHITAFAGSLRVADLDADGDDDLVTGHADGASVFLADGAGGFTGPHDLSGSDASAVRVGDVDDDGALDLVGVGHTGDIQVWLGDGSGGFTSSFAGVGPTASHGESAVLVDFDDDGDLDLVVGDTDGVDLLFRGFFNDGTGVFDLAAPVLAPSEEPMVTDLEAVDLDGDGVQEVVATGAIWRPYGNVVAGWGYDGAAFGPYHELVRTTTSAPTGLAVGDVDGDGLDDLFAANALYMHGHVLFDQGDGTWEYLTMDLGLWYQSDIFPDPVAVGDLDDDGCGDLVWRTDVDVVVGYGGGC